MEPVAYVRFIDGIHRPVFELPDGRQYVEYDDGCRIVWYWYMPRAERDAMFAEPTIVDAPRNGEENWSGRSSLRL
jgi:hypothetical protein